MEDIPPEGFRKFLRHLAMVCGKYKDRDDARDGLQNQIKKLKASSLGKKSKEKIMDEFKILESQVHEVLDKETEIMKMGHGYPDVLREIEENRTEIDTIRDALAELKQSLHTIRHKKQKTPDINALLLRIKLVEQRYTILKRDPRRSRQRLEKIKYHIDTVKLKAAHS